MISIEYKQHIPPTERTRWVQVIMTNPRSGARYSMDVYHVDMQYGLKAPYRIMRLGKVGEYSACSSILTHNAPMWVTKTIEKQLPIVAIMLS